MCCEKLLEGGFDLLKNFFASFSNSSCLCSLGLMILSVISDAVLFLHRHQHHHHPAVVGRREQRVSRTPSFPLSPPFFPPPQKKKVLLWLFGFFGAFVRWAVGLGWGYGHSDILYFLDF